MANFDGSLTNVGQIKFVTKALLVRTPTTGVLTSQPRFLTNAAIKDVESYSTTLDAIHGAFNSLAQGLLGVLPRMAEFDFN